MRIAELYELFSVFIVTMYDGMFETMKGNCLIYFLFRVQVKNLIVGFRYFFIGKINLLLVL